MARTSRRAVLQADLPLRLTIAQAGKRVSHYLILRNDGTVIEASAASFLTEDAAQLAGLPVLQRHSDAAKAKEAKRQ